MPLYFFHYHNHDSHIDDEGMELLSDAEAWSVGTRYCWELMGKFGARLPSGREYRLECLDETGRGVFAINWQTIPLMQTRE